jgi:tRNA(Leu) C34 or U34 (ribose-2'-O)-methylase TrmL
MRGYSAIGLYAPKTEANVGGAFRAAQCYGASLIILHGPRYKTMATDTMKASRHIPMIVGDIATHRPHDCQLVAVELVDGAVDLITFDHPDRAIYCFGPEDGSLPKAIVAMAQHVVKIPTNFCMNLAATVNVVLYDRLAKRRRD